MTEVAAKNFGSEGFRTWAEILTLHRSRRESQACDLFLRGIRILGIDETRIPSLEEVNRVLAARTGFRGVFVEGLEEGTRFFKLLAERKFPVGAFIRDRRDLNYTPAPDLIHDLYGHLPYFTDTDYADFCQAFGAEASHHFDRPEVLRQFERFFWFTIEFGLIETPRGRRIFGAGIVSSLGECEYALSGKPEVVPFDVDAVRHQEFRIDVMQPKLFLLKNEKQLYDSLPELAARIRGDEVLGRHRKEVQ